MGGDPVLGPLDAEHVLDALIADIKALEKAIPEMLLVLMLAKVEARREAASA